MLYPESEPKVTENQFKNVMNVLLDDVTKKILEVAFEGNKCQSKK